MMAKRLSMSIAEHGKEYETEAYSYSEIDEKGSTADVILLGPQIRYNLKHVKEKFPNTPAVVLDMQAYAVMDGNSILSQVDSLLKEK